METLTGDLDRRVRWPLTAPEGWWEGVTYCGSVEALTEALRRVAAGIQSGAIEPERWHARMFYGRAWPALMARLDEMDTQQAARERARKRQEEAWTENKQNKQTTATDEQLAALMSISAGGEQ